VYDSSYRADRDGELLGKDRRLAELQHWCHHRDWVISGDEWVGFTRSVTYIKPIWSREAAGFEKALRGLIREHFGDRPVSIPIRTDLWTARVKRPPRRPSPPTNPSGSRPHGR
jgi:hypothetical protein